MQQQVHQQVSRQRQVLRVVLDGLVKVPLRLIRVAEVPVRPALPRPVAHLLCNRQVQRVVLYSLCIVPLDPATDSLSMELRRDHVLQIFSRGCS